MTDQREAFSASEGDEWFARNPRSGKATGSLAASLSAYLTASSSVLEIGCCDGRNLAALATLVPGRFVGLDPSREAIAAGSARWPDLDLHVGTADAIPFDEEFDLVLLGFFLYLCDRSLLPRIVAEADRSLRDGGTLAILDFDVSYPRRRPYKHRPGMWSYKMDYGSIFASFPSYVLAEKRPLHHAGDGWTTNERDRISLSFLKKRLAAGYAEEEER